MDVGWIALLISNVACFGVGVALGVAVETWRNLRGRR